MILRPLTRHFPILFRISVIHGFPYFRTAHLTKGALCASLPAKLCQWLFKIAPSANLNFDTKLRVKTGAMGRNVARLCNTWPRLFSVYIVASSAKMSAVFLAAPYFWLEIFKRLSDSTLLACPHRECLSAPCLSSPNCTTSRGGGQK
jgi:hypothetical protein